MLGYRLVDKEVATEGYDFGILMPPAVAGLWREIAEILMECKPRPGTELFAEPEHILQCVMDASAIIWGGFQDRQLELILICCFRMYHTTKTMEVMYVGGKGLRKAFKHWPRVEEWAASCGATHIEARMSRSMLRFYEKMGVTETAVYFRKPLMRFAN